MSFLVFLNSWPAWFKSKIIEKFSTPKLILNPLNKSAWNLQVKLDVAASSNAEKDRSELHKVWIFLIFHWKDGFCDETEWHHNYSRFSKRESVLL